jgi:hypothetical protein
MMMLFTADENGWPLRLVSETHEGPAPAGHVAFDDLRAMVAWQEAHPDLRPPVPEEAPPVPEEVTLRQFLMAADRSKLLAAMEALKTADDIPQQTRRDIHFFLEYSNFIERNHPLIAALAPMAGVTSEQIDELFRAASAL